MSATDAAYATSSCGPPSNLASTSATPRSIIAFSVSERQHRRGPWCNWKAKATPANQLVLCTKAGYLTPDGKMPRRSQSNIFSRIYSTRNFFRQGHRRRESLHCSALSCRIRYPAQHGQTLASIASMSSTCTIRKTQLGEIPKVQFLGRIREAFYYLESAVRTGKIHFYGVGNLEWIPPGKRLLVTQCN